MFRLLFRLHLLCLLNMFLLQLLCLLLVSLLHLLLAGIIGLLLRHPPMFLVLLLLQLLPLRILVRDQLILLLQVFLVQLPVSSVGSRRAFVRWKVVGVNWRMRAASRSFTVADDRRISSACRFSRDYFPPAKFPRFCSGRNWRLTMVR